jgi:hypothetical protein
MDWFERLTGFREADYATTRSRLAVEGGELVSLVSGRRHGIGELELASLADLRARASRVALPGGRLRLRIVTGDVRQLHRAPEFNSALFQVASQFNLLEMTSERVSPEDGVTRYQTDDTQGPACAIAAGAATVYRNYFVPIAGQMGQTRQCQLDCLAELGEALADALDMPRSALWRMQNGYALFNNDGLAAIDRYLAAASETDMDQLQGLLRIGLHWGVEVTDAPGPKRPVVSQAFCSALPVSYNRLPRTAPWERFARLVLHAAYEATLAAGVLHGARGGSNSVLLTYLGGHAFGNDPRWIHDAMHRALERMAGFDLDVRLVSFGTPSAETMKLEKAFS